MAVKHDHIRRLLKESEATTDHSLHAKSLKRARNMTVPTTLTPFEWEQWYAEHGIPESHVVPDHQAPRWWKKLLLRH